MAVKTDCPRCKAHLQVPNRLAGGYVNCPQCKGRLWVVKNAPVDPTPVDTIAIASGESEQRPVGEPPAPASPPIRGEMVAAPPAGFVGASEEASEPSRKAASGRRRAQPKPASPSAPVQRKVARLVTAEAAESTLRLAADGKLPELSLEEVGGQRQESQTASRSPLFLFLIVGVSVVSSVLLFLVDWGPSTASLTQHKAAMRQKLEEQYFGSDNLDNKSLEPYQRLLRDAQRAHTRGEYSVERRKYRRVLEMLREERGSLEKGLTGSRTRDKELEEILSVLLTEG
jgi:hypothetical protein